MRRVIGVLAVAVIVTGLAVWWTQDSHSEAEPNAPLQLVSPSTPAKSDGVATPIPAPNIIVEKPTLTNARPLFDPIQIAPCNLTAILEQEVSSQLDGVFQDILVDLGHKVKAGQLLGRLDDRQLRVQVQLLEIKANSEVAEKIAKAQHDEADTKVQYALKANESGLRSVPELEYKGYLFQRERFAQEIKKAREDRQAAHQELEKARLLLALHELRSALPGEVVKVYKRNGEAVKQAEPLFRVADFNRVRIEGLCKVQQADLLRVGMKALVEPELRGEQMTELAGHTGPVTSLSVSHDGRWIASGSDDKTVILWSWPDGFRRAVLPHPAEVHSVLFAKVEKRGQDLLNSKGPVPFFQPLFTGCADGHVRHWSLSADGKIKVEKRGQDLLNSKGPVPFFQPNHEGTIRSLAVSQDGRFVATGGDDKRIGIWNAETGKHLFWLHPGDDGFSTAHLGAVTTLHFTPDGHLVSAARDNAVKVWKLEGEKAKQVASHSGRTGDAGQLGISPDGGRVLFDHGEELRILDWASGANQGSLRSRRQGRIQNLAIFSPSGKVILAGSNNGRLQLWKVPASAEEISGFRLAKGAKGNGTNYLHQLWNLTGHDVRHFLLPSATVATCGVFAPDEAVFFTGGNDKVVRVWAMPQVEQWNRPIEAEITFIGSQLERGTDMVRVRAEMDNPADPGHRLRPGTYVSLRIYPETARH